MKLAKFLSDARKSKGLTQREVAEKLRLQTSQSVSNMERGLVAVPPKHIKTLAKLYGVPAYKIKTLVVAEWARAL